MTYGELFGRKLYFLGSAFSSAVLCGAAGGAAFFAYEIAGPWGAAAVVVAWAFTARYSITLSLVILSDGVQYLSTGKSLVVPLMLRMRRRALDDRLITNSPAPTVSWPARVGSFVTTMLNPAWPLTFELAMFLANAPVAESSVEAMMDDLGQGRFVRHLERMGEHEFPLGGGAMPV